MVNNCAAYGCKSGYLKNTFGFACETNLFNEACVVSFVRTRMKASLSGSLSFSLTVYIHLTTIGLCVVYSHGELSVDVSLFDTELEKEAWRRKSVRRSRFE